MRGTWERKWLTTGNLTCFHSVDMVHNYNLCYIVQALIVDAFQAGKVKAKEKYLLACVFTIESIFLSQ